MKDKPIEITVSMTANEWCEVAEAIVSKYFRIKSGAYGDHIDPTFDEKWAAQLDSAYDKLTTELNKKKVIY